MLIELSASAASQALSVAESVMNGGGVTIDLDRTVIVQAVLFALGVLVMTAFVRAAQRIEPFTKRG